MRLTPPASCARISRATLRSCGFQPPAFAQLGKEGETPSVASFPGAASGMWKLCRFPRLQACAVPSHIHHGRCAHDGEAPARSRSRSSAAAARNGNAHARRPQIALTDAELAEAQEKPASQRLVPCQLWPRIRA